jgi:hypothetical protein
VRRNNLPSGLERYPVPTAVPTGYRLVSAAANGTGGFQTGDSELWLRFGCPSAGASRIGIHFNATPVAVDPGVIVGRHGAPHTIVSTVGKDGRALEVLYFDGMWKFDRNGTVEFAPGGTTRLSWTTQYLHTIVTSWSGYTIGVQASVPAQGGVSLDELLSIAGSTAILGA